MYTIKVPAADLPTLAVFPFRFRQLDDVWILRGLKYSPERGLKWWPHLEKNAQGRQTLVRFDSFADALRAADAFNDGVRERISEIDEDETTLQSLRLKVDKQLTSLRRRAQEERLMLNEAMQRHKDSPKPTADTLVMRDHHHLKSDLLAALQITPYVNHVVVDRVLLSFHQGQWCRQYVATAKTLEWGYREKIAAGFGLDGTAHWGRTKASIRQMLLPFASRLLQLDSVQALLAQARARGLRVVVLGAFVFWDEGGSIAHWVMKTAGGESESETGNAIWHEGTIISKNHGRIVVLPYIKENGEHVQGHTKNAPHDGKAIPRAPSDYLELPFEILDGDLMIGLFGELHYESCN